MRKVPFVVSLSSVVVALVACSSGGGGSVGSGGPSKLTTSVPASKPVSSLSPTEATQFCNDLGTFVNGTLSSIRKKTTCLRAATSAMRGATTEADLRSKCQSAYQQCLSSPDAGGGDSDTIDTAKCAEASTIQACSATVAEVSRCFEDAMASAASAVNTIDTFCNLVQVDGGGVDTSGAQQGQPASCTAIQSKCEIFGSSDN